MDEVSDIMSVHLTVLTATVVSRVSPMATTVLGVIVPGFSRRRDLRTTVCGPRPGGHPSGCRSGVCFRDDRQCDSFPHSDHCRCGLDCYSGQVPVISQRRGQRHQFSSTNLRRLVPSRSKTAGSILDDSRWWLYSDL